MSKSRLVGLDSIVFGAVLTTTTWANTSTLRVLNMVPGSAKLIIPEPTKTSYFTEDTDVADMVIAEPGDMSVEFAMRDILPSFMVLGFGGTSNTTLSWMAPITARGVVERSMQVTSKTYNGKKFTFVFPRVDVAASAELRFSNKSNIEPGSLAFKCGLLQPTNGNTLIPAIKFTRS